MNYQLDELKFETTIGAQGGLDNSRKIPVIDVSDFEQRRQQISDELWKAATEVGFFQLSHHSIPLELVKNAFEQSRAFFGQDPLAKQALSLLAGENAGWEYKKQVRPSTGNADEKESYQITLPKMNALWPEQQQLPYFKSIFMDFEYQAWALGMDILSCFAEKLGMDRYFFSQAHDRASQHYQSTLRLLHYLPLQGAAKSGVWRAGAHTDFDCLTMVFQQDGESGLQACPGKDAQGQQLWTDVEARSDLITCNIGDMLMRWSDDQLKSTLHRVRMPNPDEGQKARHSIAFFCQANKNQMIQGPKKKYPAISAQDYIKQRLQANF
ncbi:isopenicillin N synthase family oxygenase [Alginatibacterium sediminis]|uniref:2-oxoglutarate-dependent ethylene/succinate-forming enzyme n=1 Tax=Alginatibacterium sediminis TaxID=2164068 RepID=A0A420E717_9ALTE|nr:2-oxoglutarate and iron-dependent oxygenase domain-containing protein [Alginatibacterium sediminis]RKF13734.1 isopenicillin N synthase family oxygenase [Alginatibacterium sediminis]